MRIQDLVMRLAMMAASLGLGVLGGLVIAAIYVRGTRSTGQGRVVWSLPIGVTGILLARAHFLIISTSSEAVQWATLLVLFLGGALAFIWSKNRWESSRR